MKFNFEYHAPKSQEELLSLLTLLEEAEILAGGTDLIVDMRSEVKKLKAVIDFKKIDGMDNLSYSDASGLVIGPAVTVNQLLEDEVVKKKFPILVAACQTLASHQLRNRATVLGNIVSASPSADLA